MYQTDQKIINLIFKKKTRFLAYFWLILGIFPYFFLVCTYTTLTDFYIICTQQATRKFPNIC